jgi:hypothetical protein
MAVADLDIRLTQIKAILTRQELAPEDRIRLALNA